MLADRLTAFFIKKEDFKRALKAPGFPTLSLGGSVVPGRNADLGLRHLGSDGMQGAHIEKVASAVPGHMAGAKKWSSIIWNVSSDSARVTLGKSTNVSESQVSGKQEE